MPLRFEAWTLPSSGTFEKKFDIPVALSGSAGVRELSTYADETLLVPASYNRLDELVSETVGSLIRVYSGSTVIDEFDAARVSQVAGRPNIFSVSGPQRNGLVEGIGVAPWNYPNHIAQAMDHIYGGESILPPLGLGDLGSVREEWEVWHNHTGGTWTATVDGDTTEGLDHDASTGQIEGSSETLGTPAGLQGLTTVNDVTVSGSGSQDDPWVIVFFDPPNPGSVSFSGAGLTGGSTFSATMTVAGANDPFPITRSQPIDAQVGDPDEHGEYDDPPIQAVTVNLDTGADWSLRVNATARYAGSQIVLNVTPGQTYSNISVRVNPDTSGDYTIVLRDEFENLIAQNRDVPLSAGSYQALTLPSVVIPEGVTKVILRVAVTDANPSNIDDFYVNWQGATFDEGQAEATWTAIIGDFLSYAADRGVGEWLELDATETDDTLGTTLDTISFTQYAGDDTHLGHTLAEGRRLGYQWRLVPADEAMVITPAGTTSHVLQIFYVNADEIEDLTASSGAPTITVGSKGVTEAQVITRRIPYTTLIGLGAGSLSVEDTATTSETALGRIERIRDVEHLASTSSIQEFLDAQFAEQNLNLRAANATVLESATQLPFVDYTEGSKIWWQFPGILPKEARPVKRIGWTHGTQATFEVQGSKIYTSEAALAAAIDHLLRQPGRRRSQPLPVAVTGGGGGGMAHILIVSTSEPTFVQEKADYIVNESTAGPELNSIFDALPNGKWSIWMAGRFNITENVNVPSGAWIRGLGYMAAFST